MGRFPFTPFSLMRRMFEDIERMVAPMGFPGMGFPELAGEAQPLSTAFAFAPHIDVVRRADRLIVRADLPGLRSEDVRVSIQDDALVIDGERRLESEVEGEDMWRAERMYGRFRRVIPLDDGVDPESAEARFDNGVLEISLKTSGPRSRSREIKINTEPTPSSQNRQPAV